MGRIIVIDGTSNAGKTTLCENLAKNVENIIIVPGASLFAKIHHEKYPEIPPIPKNAEQEKENQKFFFKLELDRLIEANNLAKSDKDVFMDRSVLEILSVAYSFEGINKWKGIYENAEHLYKKFILGAKESGIKLPDKYINIEVIDELKILIYTENSEFNLNGISESEYPNIGLEESKKKVSINASVFKDIVNQTAFASSNEESKPVLTGINFNIVGDVLECNSTDSYRLARKVVKLTGASEENYNIVIPSHNILEFSRIIDEEDGDIELHIFNNKILFKTGNLKFESRLINGTYPNTSNLLPDSSYLVVSTNLNAFYDVIDRVSILTSDKEKNIVTLETRGDILVLKSSSVEIGRVEEKMPITKNNNEDIKISFSAKYMMEALKSFSTETVDIHFVGEIKPILIKSSEDDTLTQLVLPIRTY